MKLAELQSLVRNLAQALKAGAASQKIISDLDAIARGLEPFRDWPLAQFSDFLTKAEEYNRTGIIPLSGKTSAKKPTEPIDVSSYVQQIKDLYERSIDPNLTFQQLDAEIAKLEKKLSKEESVELVRLLGRGSFRLKKEALAEIKRWIHDRKGSFQTKVITV